MVDVIAGGTAGGDGNAGAGCVDVVAAAVVAAAVVVVVGAQQTISGHYEQTRIIGVISH